MTHCQDLLHKWQIQTKRTDDLIHICKIMYCTNILIFKHRQKHLCVSTVLSWAQSISQGVQESSERPYTISSWRQCPNMVPSFFKAQREEQQATVHFRNRKLPFSADLLVPGQSLSYTSWPLTTSPSPATCQLSTKKKKKKPTFTYLMFRDYHISQWRHVLHVLRKAGHVTEFQ